MILTIYISLLFDTRVVRHSPTSKMKMIFVLAAVVAVALAAPQRQQQQQQLLVHSNDNAVLVKEVPSNNIGTSGYHYAYELSDGHAQEQTADLVAGGTDGQFMKVRGSYTWVDQATNVKYTVNYVADETGFHPEGEHLPTK